MVVFNISPKLTIIFRGLIRRGLFRECWQATNITAILKGTPSPDRGSYCPISITTTLSMVYEKLVSYKLKKYGFRPAAQCAYRKGLCCKVALPTIFHHLQRSLDTGMESYIVQLEHSAAFDRVSRSGLVFKLKSIVVGGSVLFICREFLYNSRQRAELDGAISKWIPIAPGVPQGCVLGPLLFILYTS